MMKNILVAAALVGVAIAPPPSPDAVHAATAAMVIGVSDGVTSATTGDELTYTISLRNDGAADSGPLGVRFQPPSGAEVTTVDHDGAREDGVATWSIDLPAGGTLTLTVGAKVATLPEGVNGLAGIACITHDGTPTLCATDMNQIPGQPDIHAVVEGGPAATHRSVPWLAVGGILIGAAALSIGAFVLIRRRRAPRSP
jgi:uncharacterized repeat protein (TIGR01451 family)